MTEQKENEQRRRPRSVITRSIIVIMVLAMFGLAYFAWTLHLDVSSAREQLRKSQSRSAGLWNCDSEREDASAKRNRCRSQLTDSQQNLLKTLSELELAKADLSNAYSRLELLDAQREENARRREAFNQLKVRLEKLQSPDDRIVLNVRDGRMLIQLPTPVLFDAGSANLSRAGELSLLEVGFMLRAFPERKFEISGHTDDRILEERTAGANDEKSVYRNNWELSAKRALAVLDFFQETTLKPEQVDNFTIAGYGATLPVADNRTPDGRRQNRRIEIEFLPDPAELPFAHPILNTEQPQK